MKDADFRRFIIGLSQTFRPLAIGLHLLFPVELALQKVEQRHAMTLDRSGLLFFSGRAVFMPLLINIP